MIDRNMDLFLYLRQNKAVLNQLKGYGRHGFNRSVSFGHNFDNKQTFGLKSESFSNIELKKNMICKCNQMFAIHSALVQHKKHFCKHRKVVKSINSYQITDNKTNYKSIVVSKVDEREDSVMRSQIESKSDSKDIEINANKEIVVKNDKNERIIEENRLLNDRQMNSYVNTKLYNNIRYHLCKYNDCKFTTKYSHLMVKHIKTQHFGNEPNVVIKCPKIQENNITSSADSLLNKSLQKSVSNPKIKSESQMKYKTSTNNRELQNDNKVDKYLIELKSINGETYYFCEWNDCKHYDISLDQMNKHINETHFGSVETQGLSASQSPVSCDSNKMNKTLFICAEPNCEAKFTSPSNLMKHQIKNCNKTYEMTTINTIESGIKAEEQISSELIGSYGTKTSVENFIKYSKIINNGPKKPLYVCTFPNCLTNQKKTSNPILRQYKSYRTPEKTNMIRHIRAHTGDKPFVCDLNGCEKRFGDCTALKTHKRQKHT